MDLYATTQVEMSSSTGSLGVITSVQTQQPALKMKDMDKLPEATCHALELPPTPPNLGALLQPVSFSSFFKSARRLHYISPADDGKDAERDPLEPFEPRQFRPQGILVSTLTEHKGAVTKLAVRLVFLQMRKVLIAFYFRHLLSSPFVIVMRTRIMSESLLFFVDNQFSYRIYFSGFSG
jgi:hypothetical protein